MQLSYFRNHLHHCIYPLASGVLELCIDSHSATLLGRYQTHTHVQSYRALYVCVCVSVYSLPEQMGQQLPSLARGLSQGAAGAGQDTVEHSVWPARQ